MRFFQFLCLAVKAYRAATHNGTSYGGITERGMPVTVVFIGRGREAWRISQSAILEALNKA